MKKAITVMLAAAMLVAFATTGEAKRRTPRHTTADWKVTIATSGGFTGRGTGGVTITSDGTVVVGMPVRYGQPQQQCTSKLSDADLAAVRGAVEGANAATWRGKKFGTVHPDAMTYTLTLARGGSTSTASWFDSSRQTLPPTLGALLDAVNPAWLTAREACTAPAQ